MVAGSQLLHLLMGVTRNSLGKHVAVLSRRRPGAHVDFGGGSGSNKNIQRPFPKWFFAGAVARSAKYSGAVCSRRGALAGSCGPMGVSSRSWEMDKRYACAVLMGKVQEALLRNVNEHLPSTATGLPGHHTCLFLS